MILSACSSTRYLNDNEALVTKVKLDSIDDAFSTQAALYVQKDIRPNSKLNLALYNMFNTKNGKYRTDRVRNIGEAPHILDSTLLEISRKQIENYLKTKGFFKATVKSNVDIENKKAKITFTAKQGPEFKIRNLSFEIPDPAVDTLYRQNRESFTRVHTGTRFDADSMNLEREQIFLMMKRNGYYDYLRQYFRVVVDSNLYSSQADVRFILSNPTGKTAHPVYTIDNSELVVKNSAGQAEGIPDSTLVDSQYVFKDYSGKFRAGPITRYVFIKKGEKYNIDKENLTYDRLYDLNAFKNVKIDYEKAPDSSNRLLPQYDITPLKKMSNRIEGEFTFNKGRTGFNIGNTFTNRNVFGGAEYLEVKARYGVLFDNTQSGNILNRIFNRDFQIGVNLIFPRLLTPFRIPNIGKNGIPHTTISSSIQIFDQTNAFKNRTFINSITYDWNETRYKTHSLTPLTFEYRNGRLNEAFKDSLRNRGYELYIRTNDRQYFNQGSQYAYTLNAIRLQTYSNFIYLRAAMDAGGNTLGLFGNLLNLKKTPDSDTTSSRKIFGLTYLQYVKPEIDIRLYRSYPNENQFVARLNTGVAIPYGNSKDGLPFEKNLFAGGSNGIRAWQARTLGPGNYNRSSLADSATRSNLRNLDQLGEVRIEGNLEYRYTLSRNFFTGILRGAAFTDFGNVWRIRKFAETPGGEFKFNKFFNQVALGIGMGVRYDIQYFVFRLDVGLKVKDPQFTGSDQWVIRNLFNQREFKEQYKITNNPDRYNFFQYNFGIGMPF